MSEHQKEKKGRRGREKRGPSKTKPNWGADEEAGGPGCLAVLPGPLDVAGEGSGLGVHGS